MTLRQNMVFSVHFFMTRAWSAIQHWSIWRRPWSLVRLVISTIPVWLMLWLFNQNYVLSATVSHSIIPGHQPNRVFRVDGDDNLVGFRQQKDGQWQWGLRQAVTSFRLHMPRFVQAEKFSFRLMSAPSILTGFFNGPPTTGDVNQLLYDQQLDTLPWSHARDRSITLWSQPTIHPITTLAALTKDVINWRRVAYVGLDRFAFFRLSNPSKKTSSTIAHGLRGPHELYIYVTQPNVNVHFSVIDLHRRVGLDSLNIELASADQWRASGHLPAATKHVADDGIRIASRAIGAARAVSFSVNGLQTGVYRLNIQDSDELIVSDLTVNQPYINVINHLWLADGPSYYPGQPDRAANLAVESSDITFFAVSGNSYQVIHNGRATATIDAKHASVGLGGLSSSQGLSLSRADMQVTAAGLISIDGNQLLPLNGPTTLPLTEIDTPDKYDYILAEYEPRVPAWPRDFTVRVPKAQTVLSRGDVVVSLGTASDQAARQTRFLSATATFERGPFPWDKIFSRLRRILHHGAPV